MCYDNACLSVCLSVRPYVSLFITLDRKPHLKGPIYKKIYFAPHDSQVKSEFNTYVNRKRLQK